MSNQLKKTPKYLILHGKYLSDRKISDKQKILLALINSLSNATGYCYASNEWIGEIMGIDKDTVSKNISNLRKANIITVEMIYDKKNVLTERRIFLEPNYGVALIVSPEEGGIPQPEDTPYDGGRGGYPPAVVGNIIESTNISNNKKEINKEKETDLKLIERQKLWYREEVSKNTESKYINEYRAFCNYIFSENPTKSPIIPLLKIPNQVTYDNFEQLCGAADIKDIYEKVDVMINTPKYAKGKIYVHLTLLNWLRK